LSHFGSSLLFAGVVEGASQIARGIVNTPAAVIAPRKGKWWNENEGKWIYTNLEEESNWLDVQSADNEDILGKVRSAWTVSTEGQGDEAEVNDPYYYNILHVPISVDASTVKRQFYILARRYSPDRAGQSEEAKRMFREIGTAYVVLSNPEFREQYDKHGKDFMYADGDDDENPTPMVDPMILYSMLFGSDKFNDYIGTLSAATSASVGDSPDISKADARLLQKRRVTYLALKLADRLKEFTEGKLAISKANWKTEAEYLTKASYGTELTNTIGKVRNCCDVVYVSLGSSLFDCRADALFIVLIRSYWVIVFRFTPSRPFNSWVPSILGVACQV
jgi:hypothetical protein